jgi:hypothetical protein
MTAWVTAPVNVIVSGAPIATASADLPVMVARWLKSGSKL